MSKPYSPPYSLTSAIVSLVARIGEAVGRLSAHEAAATSLRLRRINRIRTIQGSLAIEGNTLSEAQITAILEGKRVHRHGRSRKRATPSKPMTSTPSGNPRQKRICWQRTASS